ncbi:MAG: tRNA 4-thiouridine(8) synthase ThiI, partial [Eubacteriales bacterium]|nr:tRNA 4-thiouridine(8) synthase ThiI [Eubacteriales bacterium]
MEMVLLVRYSEIHLKGLNRPFFEKQLVNAITRALKGMDAQVERAQSRIFVHGIAASRVEEAIEKLKHVFG